MRQVSIALAGIDMAQIEQEGAAVRQQFLDERAAESNAWREVEGSLRGLADDIERIKAEAEARHMAAIARLDALIGTSAAMKNLKPGELTVDPKPAEFHPGSAGPPAPLIPRRNGDA